MMVATFNDNPSAPKHNKQTNKGMQRGKIDQKEEISWLWYLTASDDEGSCLGDPRSVEYRFIAITLRSTQTWNGNTC